MLDSAESRTRLVVGAILAYLDRWPQAADTEQGIQQWWLPEMGIDVPPAEVAVALERLVQERAVSRSVLPDGSVIYRAAR